MEVLKEKMYSKIAANFNQRPFIVFVASADTDLEDTLEYLCKKLVGPFKVIDSDD